RETASTAAEGHQALLEHLRIAGSRRGDPQPSAWASAVAAWLERCPPDRRMALLASAVNAVPTQVRPGFLRVLFATAPSEVAGDGLRWLRSQPGLDPSMLLPLEVRGAAGRIAGGERTRAWRDLLARAS